MAADRNNVILMRPESTFGVDVAPGPGDLLVTTRFGADRLAEPFDLGEFARNMLAHVASQMGVPYDQMAREYAAMTRPDPRLAKADILLYRAGFRFGRGDRGSYRKMKRAIRIYGDVMGPRISHAAILMRYRAGVDAGRRARCTPILFNGISEAFIRELTAERLVDGVWLKDARLGEAYMPGRGAHPIS